jgi:lipid-A-disaccharide synthase
MRALRDLDSHLVFHGRGGPQMKALAGGTFDDWIDDAAVLGLWEVLRHYGYFRKKFRQTISDIFSLNPDVVLLIDYPGFNLRLGRALRRRGFTGKIIYYISPQVWAWNAGRIAKMARWIDLMLCIFPFEADLYNRSGLRTRFVGHPMIDRLSGRRIDTPRESNLIGLFPGSRSREIRLIFPILIEVMERLHTARPELRFEIAAASADLKNRMSAMLPCRDAGDLKVEIRTADTAGLMQRATAGIVASGSATLEAAFFRLPFVLVYKVAPLTYVAAKIVVQVPHIGMPNVLAGKEIVPEYIQWRAKADTIIEGLLALVDDQAKRNRMIHEFDRIIGELGKGGASQMAAREIVAELGS